MTTEERIKQFKNTYQQVKAEIGKAIVGHEEIVDGTLIARFERLPGLGDTKRPQLAALFFPAAATS